MKKILFINTIISLVIGIATLLVSILATYKTFFDLGLLACIVFIPSIIIALIYVFNKETISKVRITFSFILLFLQLFLSFLFICLSLFFAIMDYTSEENIEAKDINEFNKKIKVYQESLGYGAVKDQASFFPRQLPLDAKNIKMKMYTKPAAAYTYFYLTFDTNEEYIKQELKRIKPKTPIGPYKNVNE